jgi:hypothetical protein
MIFFHFIYFIHNEICSFILGVIHEQLSILMRSPMKYTHFLLNPSHDYDVNHEEYNPHK